MSDGEAQSAMLFALENGLSVPCGCNKYRRHHCGIVDPRDAEREAEKREAERQAALPPCCSTQNCIRPRGDGDRYCMYCRREKNGLPRFPEGDPEGCNLVADRKRAEAAWPTHPNNPSNRESTPKQSREGEKT